MLAMLTRGQRLELAGVDIAVAVGVLPDPEFAEIGVGRGQLAIMVAVVGGESVEVAAAGREDDLVGGDLPVMVGVADQDAVLRPNPRGQHRAAAIIERRAAVGARGS